MFLVHELDTPQPAPGRLATTAAYATTALAVLTGIAAGPLLWLTGR